MFLHMQLAKAGVALAERSREPRGRLPDRCAVAPSHARDTWELRDLCLTKDRNLNGRKLMLLIRPLSFACCYCVF